MGKNVNTETAKKRLDINDDPDSLDLAADAASRGCVFAGLIGLALWSVLALLLLALSESQ